MMPSKKDVAIAKAAQELKIAISMHFCEACGMRYQAGGCDCRGDVSAALEAYRRATEPPNVA
jgi:hypothetical protein